MTECAGKYVLKKKEKQNKTHFTERAKVKSEGLSIPGASIHIVSHQQYKFQQLAKAFALLYLFAGSADSHDVRFDVIHLLFKLKLKENSTEPRPQSLHIAHLIEKKIADFL